MQFLDEYIIYPVAMLLVVGFFFMHVGLRNRSSLIALLSLVFMIVWSNSAHWVVHTFLKAPSDFPFERIGQFSAHPVFDLVNAGVVVGVAILFCGAFLVSAVSISARTFPAATASAEPRPVARIATRVLWALVAASVATTVVACLRYRYLMAVGPLDIEGRCMAAAALSGTVCAILFFAIAIRRGMLAHATAG